MSSDAQIDARRHDYHVAVLARLASGPASCRDLNQLAATGPRGAARARRTLVRWGLVAELHVRDGFRLVGLEYALTARGEATLARWVGEPG